jgi:3-methyladenine DNA glycosylase AlkD
MGTEITTLADQLEAELRAIGSPERAVTEKAYLKSNLEFLGSGSFVVGRRIKEVTGAEPMAHDAAVALAEALWSRPIFELRAAAVEILSRRDKVLGPDDLPLLERLIRESGTWALVDGLAGDVASAIVARHPVKSEPILDRWAADADFWVRRSALLAELKPLKAGAPFDRFGRHADSMLEEREFFICKAIGWVLRETGKRRPDDVFAWLTPRAHRASGVTLREAVKYLPQADADSLMEAYRARGAAVGRSSTRSAR